MSDPLSGYAAINFTLSQLKALTVGTAGSQSLFLARAAEMAAEAGVTAAEFLNSLRTTTTVGGQIGSLAESAVAIAETHGVTAVTLEAEIAVAAEAAAAAGGAGAGALTAAETTAPAVAASGAATAAAIFVGVALVTAIVYTGASAWMAGSEADEAEAMAARQDARLGITTEDRESAASGQVAFADGYVLVQVTNHPRQALSIKSMAQIADHNSGTSQLHLCNFLHGGRCGGDVVDTPNGSVTIAASPVAQLAELGQFGDYASALSSLCSRVGNVAPAPLAEGFTGDYGGSRVTIDVGGFSNPCA